MLLYCYYYGWTSICFVFAPFVFYTITCAFTTLKLGLMKSTAIPNMFMGYICLSHKHVLHNSQQNEMHILRMMNCTNIGKCWYTITESGSLWPSSLSLPSSISLFHWQIISVNSKNEEHFIHCFIFLFSVTKNYIESHSVRSSILFLVRIVCYAVYKTCVHSLSSYLIFIPLHFFTRLSLFSALLLSLRCCIACVIQFVFFPFISSFAGLGLNERARHRQIIIITNCHEQGYFPFGTTEE